jgi:histone acetyltransferase (RNA polymerase elongator complex component)
MQNTYKPNKITPYTIETVVKLLVDIFQNFSPQKYFCSPFF